MKYPDFGISQSKCFGRWCEGFEHIDDDDSKELKLERTTY